MMKKGIMILFNATAACFLLMTAAIGYAADTSNAALAVVEKKDLPTLTLTLKDEYDEPLVGVKVAAMEGNFASVERGVAVTDKEGKAVFKNLKSSSYYFFADVKTLQKHDGYIAPAAIREFKTVTSYLVSDVNTFDMSQDVEFTYVIKKDGFIWFETFLDVFRSGRIILINKKMGISQIIPVASADFIQIYMPLRRIYQIMTIKDNDFDSWIIDFYAHSRMHIELL